MRKTILGVLLAVGSPFAFGTIIITPEAPGVQSTTVAHTITETFNSLSPNNPLGQYVSAIGTYSSGAEIVSPDAYGGSNGSRYISVGAQSGTLSFTLTFSSLQSYFGLFWAAGDAQNRLDFYNGNTLVKTVQISDYVGSLSNAYLGNPNNHQDSGEKFAYLNFSSNNANTNFDKVVFRNLNSSTGFETDNHAILSGVPEPTSAGLIFIGLGALTALARRRKLPRN